MTVFASNFALSFSLKFLSIFEHISGSTEPITLSIDDGIILVKRDDVRSGTKA